MEISRVTQLEVARPDSDFGSALLDGLSAEQKSIPCRFFYDAAGSALFERITELPEYYPTRTEMQILRDHAREMVGCIPPGASLIEFGSGSSRKTELLLDALPGLHSYVPIDISAAALSDATARLKARRPELLVVPICADFADPLVLPAALAPCPRLGFFPGSTIGNLTQDAAVRLLANMRQLLGKGAFLIVGADLKKDKNRLERAYDDAEGVTAAFNLNLLRRANRELGADFDLSQFDHQAVYDEAQGRIDMYLVSQADQTVRLLGRRIRFKAGERVHTEHSHKYDVDGFRSLGRRAGWQPLQVWTDPDRLFSVHLFGAV
jgi:dimethylhistidine N-methyltransferase